MSAHDLSEPAFPFPQGALLPGMTLRDYFAAKAMQGMLAAGRDVQYGGGTLQSEATAAYQIADAMLKAREA